jgi:diguanylate cyclase (GGDEF)-like protein
VLTAADGSSLVRLTAFDAAERVEYERELLQARRAAECSEARSRALHRVVADLSQASDPDAVAACLVTALSDVLSARTTAVWRADPGAGPGDDALLERAGGVRAPVELAPDLLTTGADHLVAQAARTGEVVVIASLDECEVQAPHLVDVLVRARLQTLVAVPLLSEGALLGVYLVAYQRARAHGDEDLELHRTLGRHAGQALERASLHEELGHLALHDPLTGLPNRMLLYDRIEQALAGAARRGAPVCLMMLDLDGFKQVNDGLGHRAGDEVLVQVGRRLSGVVRTSDTVARLGGDEFVVLCEGVDEHVVGSLLEEVEQEVSRPMVVDGEQVCVTTSIGVVMHLPDAATDTSGVELVRAADAAMYRAKKQGKARHSLYDATLRHEAEDRGRTEALIRTALEGDGVVVHYQPLFDLVTGAATGVEALCRLRGPDGGLVMPDVFIPVAEQRGLVLHLGRRVLLLACRQLAAWHATGLEHVSMSVNIAADQAAQEGFVDVVADVLRETGCPPASLVLELTESTLLTASPSTVDGLRRLRGLGIGIAIDDFGTRYASLHYVQHFPLTELKIDKSFVAGLPERRVETAIVTAVAGMARALDLVCVVEGIETAEQRAFLATLGVVGQGYHLGRPTAPDVCEAALRAAPRQADPAADAVTG